MTKNRRLLQAAHERRTQYLDCSVIFIGDTKLGVGNGASCFVQDGSGVNYTQLFLAMLDAGWAVPKWLSGKRWYDLRLTTLDIAGQSLPEYTPDMPITIKHRADSIQHIIEKPITLTVGESCAVSFVDSTGKTVWCYVNDVILIDMWRAMKKMFNDIKALQDLLPKELDKLKDKLQKEAARSHPQGMGYIGIVYECTQKKELVFYTQDFLEGYPQSADQAYHLPGMRSPFAQATGTHGLPLQLSIIETMVPADTVTLAAELFAYREPVEAWTERV